jgi:hypothetical protein
MSKTRRSRRAQKGGATVGFPYDLEVAGGAGFFKLRGGGCGCDGGGGAPTPSPWPAAGGYRATRKNRALLAKLRSGRSIGFTATASLKAKGLLPRTSKAHYGKKVLGPKYRSK